MAVRLVVLLLEGSFVELLQAEGTHKVLRVKFAMHGSDAPACDWLLTAIAQGAAAGVIMHLAVGSALVFKETSTRKGLMAFLKRRISMSFIFVCCPCVCCPCRSLKTGEESLAFSPPWSCSFQGANRKNFSSIAQYAELLL